MNYNNVDKVIKLFYDFLPHGSNFSDSVCDFNFDCKEQSEILKFLTENVILKPWGDHSKVIITSKGEDIINVYGGIENFLAHRQEEINEKERLDIITNKKLISDAKLSKWQVKIFWPMFIIALIGGLYSIYSIIDAVVGESEEQKIERILDLKLQEQRQKQKTSTSQTIIDTRSIYDLSKKATTFKSFACCK